ncbi:MULTISPECIES: chorismate mutase [Pseudomonas]|uniref:chorismate mutase n=1 Tax=Pseudomonas fluorescens TaxID=294 RepID=A0A5E6P0Q4_PSEFL|nr:MULTISPECIES: chorismate mutase [Pseudomonas]VVM36711.1 Secreted chorismate mutase [Pseudomonas fluorescens]
MRTRLSALLLAPALLLQGCTPIAPPSPLSQLLDSVDRRLDLATAVALSKWDSGQAVQATDREQQVIAKAQSQADRFGLSEQRAGDFFADQIEANKLLQYSALSRWQAQGYAPPTPRTDLQTQLRPQLDRLQHVLLSQLAEFDRSRPQDCRTLLAQAITHRTQNPPRTLALIRATGQLCRAD